MVQSNGYAALSARAELVPFAFERRDLGPHDVRLEIIGRVMATGSQAKQFAVGDPAAIGCIATM